ncbi:MAG: HlyD family efflux transporter periplasmic adaptor subunit [Synergistaceae bacterium]|nr:HlyD family efflux transporter periplasmic adaptor subunit [Synergistaceae bacterium]
MVRRFEPDEPRRFKPMYWLMVFFVIVIWIWAFKLYFDRYEYLHPEITWAIPGIDVELVKIHGVLLWKEVPLPASAGGIVTYPQGTGPVRVSRGSVVAKITSGNRASDVKAYQQGYFVAALDGNEQTWRYSEIWPGFQTLPEPGTLNRLKNGLLVGKGQPVGKLIEQPQELRFIGYSRISGDMAEQIKSKKLRVKMDGVDTVSAADIRVSTKADNKIKLYLTLPWFQPESVLSRKYTLTIEAGRTEGALVPQTSIIELDGRSGVYMVRGSRVVFVPVKGKRVDNKMFIITKGVSVGDAVVEDASTAREGRIQLW